MRAVKKKITILPATQEDIEDIKSITLEAFNKYARDLGMPEKVKALYETDQDILNDLQSKNVFIGLLGDEKLGSIRFEVFEGKIAYISRFGVKLIAQGCGMGRALMGAVEQACRDRGLLAIALHTSSRMASLMRFYYGQGYHVDSVTTDRGYIRTLMIKELTDNYNIDYSVLAHK